LFFAKVRTAICMPCAVLTARWAPLEFTISTRRQRGTSWLPTESGTGSDRLVLRNLFSFNIVREYPFPFSPSHTHSHTHTHTHTRAHSGQFGAGLSSEKSGSLQRNSPRKNVLAGTVSRSCICERTYWTSRATDGPSPRSWVIFLNPNATRS